MVQQNAGASGPLVDLNAVTVNSHNSANVEHIGDALLGVAGFPHKYSAAADGFSGVFRPQVEKKIPAFKHDAE